MLDALRWFETGEPVSVDSLVRVDYPDHPHLGNGPDPAHRIARVVEIHGATAFVAHRDAERGWLPVVERPVDWLTPVSGELPG